MKSFKQVIAEVAQPHERGAEEEQAFKDQHTYEVIPHPVALDHQFTGDIPAADAARPADNKTPESTYDTAYAYGMNAIFDKAGLGESADDNHTVDIDHTGGSDANAKKHNITIKKNKGTDNSHDASGKKKDLQKYLAKHYDSAEDAKEHHPEVHESVNEDAAQEIPMMSQQLDFIAMAAKAIKESLKGGGDPEEWYQGKLGTAHDAMKTLHANIDSGSDDSVDTSPEVSEALVGGQHKLDRDKDGDIDGDDFAKLRAKKKQKPKTEGSCGTVNASKKPKYESTEDLDERNALNMTKKKAVVRALGKATQSGKQMTRRGIDGVSKRTTDVKKDKGDGGFKNNTKQREIEDGKYALKSGNKKLRKETNESIIQTIEENVKFKVGLMKLKDGSSVTLKKQDADLLTKMFKDLSPNNRKSLGKAAMVDKVGFEEILSFAREAL